MRAGRCRRTAGRTGPWRRAVACQTCSTGSSSVGNADDVGDGQVALRQGRGPARPGRALERRDRAAWPHPLGRPRRRPRSAPRRRCQTLHPTDADDGRLGQRIEDRATPRRAPVARSQGHSVRPRRAGARVSGSMASPRGGWPTTSASAPFFASSRARSRNAPLGVSLASTGNTAWRVPSYDGQALACGVRVLVGEGHLERRPHRALPGVVAPARRTRRASVP